jgi:hypothetical protein
MFMMEPRKVTVVAALFCLVAGAFCSSMRCSGCDAASELAPNG